MRQLHYSGEFIIVSYDICEAIFHYARALANANLADVVTIPILANGKRDFSNLLLGPASALFCTPAPHSDVNLDDPKVLSYMRERTLALRPSRAHVESPSAVVPAQDYVEYEPL